MTIPPAEINVLIIFGILRFLFKTDYQKTPIIICEKLKSPFECPTCRQNEAAPSKLDEQEHTFFGRLALSVMYYLLSIVYYAIRMNGAII